MAIKNNTAYLYVDDSGGTYNPSNDPLQAIQRVIIKRAPADSGTLTGSVTITATNVQSSLYYVVEFEDTFVLGAFNFTVFGQALTASQLLNNPVITVRDDGTNYHVYVQGNGAGESVGTPNLVDKAVTLAKLADLNQGALLVGNSSDRPEERDFSGSGRIGVGDGTDFNSVAVSNHATLSSTGALTLNNDVVDNNILANIPEGSVKVGGSSDAPTDLDVSADGAIIIGDGTGVKAVVPSGAWTMDNAGVSTMETDSVVTSNITDDNVTVTKVSAPLKVEDRQLDVSFETGEVGDFKIRMGFKGSLQTFYGYATKAIAATSDATITPKNNAGTTMTNGIMTFTASDPRGTAYTATPTANNTFNAGDILTFTTAKADVGGKATLSLSFLKID